MYKINFYNITDNNIVQIKTFWNFIRPFFCKQGLLKYLQNYKKK